MCDCNKVIQRLEKVLRQHKCNCKDNDVIEEIKEGIEKVEIKSKKALLIGINYIGSDGELGGCINDVKNVKKMLIGQYNFKEEEILMITDETEIKPTLENIITYLGMISQDLDKFSNVYLHYSGHGASIEDTNNDEKDGKDECLVPLDYEEQGIITDDMIKSIFTNNFNKIRGKCDTKFTVVIDACHSASMLDLKYNVDCTSVLKSGRNDKGDYLYNDWTSKFSMYQNDYKSDKINMLMISGCRDSQTSADAYINEKYQGALTFYLLKVLELNKYDIKIKYLLKNIHCMLKIYGYDQKPVISSGKYINISKKFEI